MIYISPDKEYPRYIGNIQAQNPNWEEGDELPVGWQLVYDTEPPKPGLDELVYEGFPVEIKGVITRNWEVRNLTAEELERRNAPANARAKLIELGFTELEISALVSGLLR
jgi:hypothetical protein